MPVTVRNLTVHKFSGAGKKAPTNLRYDPVKKQVVNIKCDCVISTLSPCIGTYTTGQFFGDAVCDGSRCTSTITSTSGVQVLAIPGTSYVLDPNETIFMVNCSTSNVYWVNDDGVTTPTLILPGYAAITNPTTLGLVTYTFSS